jgi:uncharacterized membrane protein
MQPNKELVKYFEENRKKFDLAKLREQAIKQGRSPEEVDLAIKSLKSDFSEKKINLEKFNIKSRLFAFLAFFIPILGSFLALIFEGEDKYIVFYSKQGFIFGVLILGIFSFFSFFIRGKIVGIMFIVWAIGCIFALLGKEGGLPILRSIANKF